MTDIHTRTRAPMITPLEKRLMLDASLPAITGQVLWLDAADASTIRDGDGDNAATGTGGSNNGFSGSVATWVDKSGSGYNVIQNTAANRPTYTVGGLNGRNVITFDGTNDKLTNAAAQLNGNDYTIFLVFDRSIATGRDAVFELGNGASRNALFVNDSSNRLGYYVNNSFYNSTNVYTPGTYEIVTMAQIGTSINLWRNNSNEISTTSGTRNNTTGIYVGDDSSGGDELNGHIAEVIVYDRVLTSDERRDVENYLAGKWGRTLTGNVAPVIATNTGATVSQSDPVTISAAMLSATDADNTEAHLKYTITDLADYGTLTNTNTSHTYILGETFTQADINNGYIHYTHNGTANFTDSFSFTVTDQYATTAAATFNLIITPDNQAPALQGWTSVSSENFEAGATGWSDNFTETSNPYLTRFLGRHSMEGGAQNTYKTYTMTGTQDYTVLTFDFYRLDSWDGEQFRIFIDDVMVFNQGFTTGFTVIPDGSLGNVSWTVQEVTGSAPNFVYGSWADQIMRFTMRIDNSAAGTFKLGFSSTLDQATSDESWGVDNIDIYEVKDGGLPGPLSIVEGMANGTLLGTVTARDPDVGQTLTYSITGGTGAGIFAINSSTGAVTLSNTAAVNYETTTSYTLTIRVTDDGTPSMFDEETVTINVLNRPENTAPTINPLGPISIAENTALNTVIGTATGSDAEGHTITWSITGGNTDNIFAINSSTGAIRIANTAGLNYEWDNSYTLTIQARDNGYANMTSTRNVTVNITNINEAPTFNIPQSFLNQNPYLQYNAATGNFYRYVGTATTYAAATTAASAALLNGVAGHIVTIGSAAENTYVRALGSGALWLGASDATVEGEWVWAGTGPEGGQIFSIGSVAQGAFYTNWTAGQPDNGSNSDFLEMATGGQWTDVNGGNRAYVIEWEGTAVMAALGNGPFTLAENPALNQVVGSVHARDADAGDTLAYSVTGGTGAAHFAINSSTGEITVTNPSAVNFETATSFTLDVRVQDAGGLFSTQTVTINITDVNETPVMPAAGPFSVAENAAVNTVVGSVTATDVDAGQTLTYSITGGNVGNVFAINASTGAIRIANTTHFDYELLNTYNLTVRATDNGTGSLFASRTITINVTNVNEAPTLDAVQQVLNSDPTLHYSAATGNFYRLVSTNVNLATAQVNAAAATVNGVAGYVTSITSAAENAFVRSLITASTWIGGTDVAVEGEWRWSGGPEAGQLFWLGNASGSAQGGFYTNWNGGEPNNSGGNEDGIEMQTSGIWNDTNAAGTRHYVIEWNGADVIASLTNGPYTINENMVSGTVVGTAHANDPDAGDTISYSITGGTGAGLFVINATTGQITSTSSFNYESVSSYTLDLRVQDVAGLFDTLSITISINDINDAPSTLTLTGNHIVENSPHDTLVGTFSTFDEDPTDTHTYSIISNPGGKFKIVGDQILSDADIDYEQTQTINIVVRTNDGNGGTLDRTFMIQIGDVLDTFTPPPPSGSADGVNNFVPREEEEGDATLNLLGSTLGGEQTQGHAFYDVDGWQVLRENITFRLREILSLFGRDPSPTLSVQSGEDTNDSVEMPEQEDVDTSARYTNLREAMEFLQSLEQEEDGEESEGDANAQERIRSLPDNTIDRQFVDVMTYHEERAKHLRKALMSA